MEELNILRGNKTNLPTELSNDNIYVATSQSESDYSSVYVCGDEYPSKEYIDNELTTLVTQEEFADVKSKANSAIQSDDLKTINNESIVGDGDITIDLTLFVLVPTLPTENINPHKIYLLQNASTSGSNRFDEYLYDDENKKWELIGFYTAKIDLSEYIKTTDADAKYLKMSSGGGATISMSSSGSMSNFGNNGQAFNAVRECAASITGYKINAASFGVKLDGTTAFSHKKYDTFNPSTGAYTGAKNTAVLTFSGPTGLRYAKNTGGAADVTDDMFKYVGVIDSPDERQRVYSKAQVDALIGNIKTVLTSLGATQEQIDSITI